ncbi:MAG: methyltransferase family protein [Candidatus Hodarchaeota archaeon]
MSLPVVLFLILLFTQYPAGLILEVAGFVRASLMSLGGVISYVLIITGGSFAIYSIIYLWRHRKEGLVTSGPYGFVRHPQYTGFLLLTLGFTGLTYWWLNSTFGVGWLSKEATVALWLAQLGAYIVLGLIEDSYLAKTFGDEYIAYRRRVASLIPFGRTNWLDIPLGVGFLGALLAAVILLQTVMLGGVLLA